MIDASVNRQSYDKIAAQWAESRNYSFVSQLVVDFAQLIKPGGNILDQGFQLTGIDASPQMLASARQNIGNRATLLHTDFFDFKPSGLFDGILAFDSFFHFPKAKQQEIYPLLDRWLRPGGILLFTHGDKEGEISGEMFGEPFYYSCLNTGAVCDILKQLNFEILFLKEDYRERDTDRALVIMAKKVIMEANQKGLPEDQADLSDTTLN